MYSRSGPRRRHGDALKAQVLAECDQPGASVARVAAAHGLNANLVHKWRRGRGAPAAKPAPTVGAADPVAVVPAEAKSDPLPTFIPVQLPAPVPAAAPAAQPVSERPTSRGDIRIELKRGDASIAVQWPASAAGDCAAWLRELAAAVLR